MGVLHFTRGIHRIPWQDITSAQIFTACFVGVCGCFCVWFAVKYRPTTFGIVFTAGMLSVPSFSFFSSAPSPLGPVDYLGGALWLWGPSYSYVGMRTTWTPAGMLGYQHIISLRHFLSVRVLLQVHLSSRVRSDAGPGLLLGSGVKVWRCGCGRAP